jgi:hypothetical protein
MDLNESLTSVRNDLIQFVTVNPSDSQFTSLGRRVVITGPPELLELTRAGDVRVLDELVALLKDKDRAWAAVVLLSALTRREEEIVNAFANSREKWWDAVGNTAYDCWSRWLNESRAQLIWDADSRAFLERK